MRFWLKRGLVLPSVALCALRNVMPGDQEAVSTDLVELRKENAELKQRVAELEEDNLALRRCCASAGVAYEDAVAASRHRRAFSEMLERHRLHERVGATKVLATQDVLLVVVQLSGGRALASVSSPLAQACRALRKVQPWAFFAGYCTRTLRVRSGGVFPNSSAMGWGRRQQQWGSTSPRGQRGEAASKNQQWHLPSKYPWMHSSWPFFLPLRSL